MKKNLLLSIHIINSIFKYGLATSWDISFHYWNFFMANVSILYPPENFLIIFLVATSWLFNYLIVFTNPNCKLFSFRLKFSIWYLSVLKVNPCHVYFKIVWFNIYMWMILLDFEKNIVCRSGEKWKRFIRCDSTNARYGLLNQMLPSILSCQIKTIDNPLLLCRYILETISVDLVL